MLFQSASGLAVITLLGQLSFELPQIPSPGESSIPFNITQQSNDNAIQTLDGRNWRHNFDLLLTRSSDSISIFDEFGNRHDFGLDADNIESGDNLFLTGSRGDSGSIHRDGDTIRWSRPNGLAVDFQGSLPYRISRDDDQALILFYNDGRLTEVRGEDYDSLRFHYSNGRLGNVEPHEIRFSCEQHNQDIPAFSPASSSTCDSDAHPAPASTQTPSFTGAIAVDLRPATCNSYFVEYFGTTRGQEIEYGLDTHSRYQRYSSTVRSFPIIDLIGDDELLIVRSRDLTSASYDPQIFPDGLYRRLLQDALDIQDKFITPLQTNGFLESTELGETTRVDSEILDRPMVLEVIIRHGFASPEHIAQINRAREVIEQTYGIALRVIEIP